MTTQQLSYKQTLDNAVRLYSQNEINTAISGLSQKINAAYAQQGLHFDAPTQQPLVALTVMNGGMMFSSLLLLQLGLTIECDYIHATRYAHAKTGGELALLAEPKMDLYGRHILLLDDIFDDGITLERVKKYCFDRGATSVQTAVLIYKNKQRDSHNNGQPDFEALRVPDEFIFGMGMDANGLFRNAPGIYYFKNENTSEHT